MKEKILVTGYIDPDLDGTACMIAYSELLKKQNSDANPGIFGKPHREAEFILVFTKIKYPKAKDTTEYNSVILVDASNKGGISKEINPDKVIEIIDHRKANEAHLFKNAKVQIELVGAAATLVTEKFMKSKIEPSESSCVLLYAAIVSNTLNFKSNTTTQRDKKAAQWLKSKVDIPHDFVKRMFSTKSDFEGKSLREILIEDYKKPSNNEKVRVGIFQLEVVGLERIIKENEEEITQILKEFKESGKTGHIFLTGVDLEKGFNMFVAADNSTKELLEKSLGVKFKDKVAKREGLIMRKEIIPVIEKYT